MDDQSAPTELPPSANSRRFERMDFTYPGSFALDDGTVVHGVTKNVAIRGVFLQTSGCPPQLACGVEGTLRLEVVGERLECYCSVAHTTDEGIGLDITKGTERFGFALTMAVFGDIGHRTGVEITSKCGISASIGESFSSVGRVEIEKIGNNDIRFFTTKGRAELPMGAKLAVTIRCNGESDVVMRGILFSHTPNHIPGRWSCGVRFVQNDPQSVRQIERIVDRVRRSQLHNAVTARARVNSLFAGEPVISRDRVELRNDINRFFGPRPVPVKN